MQAPPSHTASGEHVADRLSSPAALAARSDLLIREKLAREPGGHGPARSRPGVFPEEEGGRQVVAGIADGIGLAHDAGNLLGAIRLYCDLLALPGVLRSEHRHYADELRQLTARSGSLIDGLLAAGRPQTGGEEAARGQGPVRPGRIVMECRGMLHTIAAPRPVTISVDARADGEVAVPREAFERILVNLTKNAAEAAEPGTEAFEEDRGAIAVRVSPAATPGPDRAEGIALSVEDFGRGMDETAVRAALSGRGKSASSSDGERPGRGIGLRVVRELASRTGGALRIRSRVGQGTTVEIVWAAMPGDGGDTG